MIVFGYFILILFIGLADPVQILQPPAGAPLPGLSNELLDRFLKGKESYIRVIEPEEGLGPILNQQSCASCHNNPVGGPGAQTVIRFGRVDKKGGFQSLGHLGGSLFQSQSIDDNCLETIPQEANIQTNRLTNGSIAFGLVESLSDEDILLLQSNQPTSQRGVIHWVNSLENPNAPLQIGKFGWKSQLATVLDFSADASREELGFTNRILPDEVAPNGNIDLLEECDLVLDPEDGPDKEGFDFIDRVTDFQRFLGVPPQTPKSGMTGENIFNQIGCSVCHVANLMTSNDAHLEEVLRAQQFSPYSDFMLHDMGINGDGITQGQAGGRYIRTQPLWNLRTRNQMWHDGRFSGGSFEQRVVDAIMAHNVFGSQGQESSASFMALDNSDQNEVVNFLNSLGRLEFDTTGDGRIRLNDFNGLAFDNNFLNCFELKMVTPDSPCAVHDLNQDGKISLYDLDGFSLAYEEGLVDCNLNGISDWREIIENPEVDSDLDGVLDICRCKADFNFDLVVNILDLLDLIANLGPCSNNCPTDLNLDGTVNVIDLLELISKLGPCE